MSGLLLAIEQKEYVTQIHLCCVHQTPRSMDNHRDEQTGDKGTTSRHLAK
jgi:hypothetical protein